VCYYGPRSFRAQYLTPFKDSLYFILNENLQMSCSRHLDGAVPLLRTNPLMVLIDTLKISTTVCWKSQHKSLFCYKFTQHSKSQTTSPHFK